jgi:phosphoenolpyruvate-protein phosphotransferase
VGELALQGVSAAPGVTSGKAVVLDHSRRHDGSTVPVAERADEAGRAHEALLAVAADLERIAGELRDAGRPEEAEIVETGVLMALDPKLGSLVEVLVTKDGLRASSALEEATEQTALELAQLADTMLSQRADDVRSIGRRAAARLSGTEQLAADAILVAGTLGPADVAELAPKVKGIALAGGGVTAHAAIVARSLGLPMVVGLGGRLLEIEDGEEVVVDGDGGAVVRRPDATRIAHARADAERTAWARELALSRREESARTRDGRTIRVLANASTVAELREAMAQGAEGVGLLRSELLFLEATAWPRIEEQVSAMRPVLEMLHGLTATVRLFDFGGDKTPPFLAGTSKRGIDLLLDHPDRLREHVAAILEAGSGTRLRLLVPMVDSPEQLVRIRAMLGPSDAELGAMVETPEAAEAAENIASKCQFLSIGTNDLTQLVLGLDRERSNTAPVLDPRVLRLIAATTRAGRAIGIPVDVCGEAASDSSVMPVLVGLGVDELSVAAARVGQVREWVRGLDYATTAKASALLLRESRDTSSERV